MSQIIPIRTAYMSSGRVPDSPCTGIGASYGNRGASRESRPLRESRVATGITPFTEIGASHGNRGPHGESPMLTGIAGHHGNRACSRESCSARESGPGRESPPRTGIRPSHGNRLRIGNRPRERESRSVTGISVSVVGSATFVAFSAEIGNRSSLRESGPPSGISIDRPFRAFLASPGPSRS